MYLILTWSFELLDLLTWKEGLLTYCSQPQGGNQLFWFHFCPMALRPNIFCHSGENWGWKGNNIWMCCSMGWGHRSWGHIVAPPKSWVPVHGGFTYKEIWCQNIGGGLVSLEWFFFHLAVSFLSKYVCWTSTAYSHKSCVLTIKISPNTENHLKSIAFKTS